MAAVTLADETNMSSLGRFTILQELGRGAMGIVFRAHDPDMARDVAIKVLRKDAALGPAEYEEMARRFDREAMAAGGLTHPNIVAHYERGQAGDWKYIVMELVEGRALSDLMSHDPRPTVPASLAILSQMASALDYAHGKGVIHRDIKPGNVLVQSDGGIKIADFGVAKCTLPGAATSSSMVIGSPHYMAPEQIEARPVTGQADQWALAVTAYELIAGRKPFQSESMASLFQQILAAAPPDPHQLDPSLPPAVKHVFARALDKSALARFPTCAAFVDALSAALAAPVPAPAFHIQTGWLWAAAMATTLILLAASNWTVLSRGGSTRAAPRADPVSTFQRGEVRRNQRDRLPYVWVAPGTFRMGCSAGDTHCRPDETTHPVTLTRGYWFGQTEVTTKAFKRFSIAGAGHLPPAPVFNAGWSNDLLPITNVPWDLASAYCRWAEGRLPTEAEWEYAARAGNPDAHYGPYDDISWNHSNSGLQAHPVAAKRPNSLGLFDTLGNVWEWTADRYDETYYSHSPAQDPTGPAGGNFHVVRGGSWLRDSSEVRVSQRYPLLPQDPDQTVGLRCVIDQIP